MSRRHSVVDAYAVVDAKIRDTMNQLSNLWDEVDMKDSMRCNRVEKAFAHITQLCDDMVTGERDMVTSLRLSIREDLSNVEKMRRELEMDGFQRPADIKDGSIALRRRLQAEVKDLEEEFNRRHEEQKALIEKLERLKTRLASEFQFEHDLHSLFPVSAFQQYTSTANEMEEDLSQRWKQVDLLQTEIRQWREMASHVAQQIDGDDELRSLLETNIDSDVFVFSRQIVDDLKAYHQELKPLYDQWLEEIEFRWTEQYELLADLWEKCMIPHDQRHYSAVFEPAKNSEDVLSRMQAERERLEAKYASCKGIYDLVEKWKTAWNERLEIEERRRQPDYYKKTNVLPDNKRDRELGVRMNALDKEIASAYRRHLKENPDDVIRIHGKEPSMYIASVEEEHQQEIKFLLQLKKEEKTRLQSPTPSRTPRTAQKRTIFKTPASSTKTEPVAKRLHFEGELPPCMSPATSEMISFITPTRRQLAGPKTSSPKETITPSRTTTPLSKRAATPSSMASGASSSHKPLTRRNF
ncbi:hypothetical protein L3Y34_014133 [Caenorhabditis briggsae]|uniref:Protein CBR-SPD-1 n=1 Tax=Caenorhabditis briggsae TaxID=6238 RepID=A0AAE9DQR6_CAEBR|nr:hypothetical protein L3Y34_014133 [Caenorhabditis briggsae]